MINQDIKVESDPQFSLAFGGGALFYECKNCGSEVASAELPYPGTKEQREECKRQMQPKLAEHVCKS